MIRYISCSVLRPFSRPELLLNFKLAMFTLLLMTSVTIEAVNSTNAKWFSYEADGSLNALSSAKWQQDWTHATILKHNLLLIYDQNTGAAKTAIVSHDGTLSQPKTYNWTKVWSDVMAADFKNQSDANLVLYSRITGKLKAFYLDKNKLKLRFSQTIPNLISNTDKAIGWDIVVPFSSDNTAFVLFYQRSTGTAAIYRYQSELKFFVAYSTLSISNYWDQIKPGNFDGDDDEELVFHNQDSGQTRIWDPLTEAVKDLPNAGISHTAILGVGKHYGGGSQSDIMLYQAHYRLSEECGVSGRIQLQNDDSNAPSDASRCFGGGRGIVYVDNASGNYEIKSINNGWRSDWTHVISNNFNFGLYSNAREVNVRFVIAGLTSELGKDEWEDSGITRWMEAANRSFAAAGIEFKLLQPKYTQDKVIAGYACGGNRAAVNKWVDENINDNAIPVIITVGNSGGCSSGRAKYLAMPRPTGIRPDPDDNKTTYKEYYRGSRMVKHDYPSARGLAHEMGHYFQLSHAHKTKKPTRAEVEVYLNGIEKPADHASIHNLDGDRSASTGCTGKKGCYLATYDTMPALSMPYWSNLDVDRCDDKPTYTLSSNLATIKYSATPHDVMSYIRCDRTALLSKDQIRAVRQALYNKRKKLIQ